MTFFSSRVIGRERLAMSAGEMEALMVAFTFPIVIDFDRVRPRPIRPPVLDHNTLSIHCNQDLAGRISTTDTGGSPV
jgi:hypothetical protein